MKIKLIIRKKFGDMQVKEFSESLQNLLENRMRGACVRASKAKTIGGAEYHLRTALSEKTTGKTLKILLKSNRWKSELKPNPPKPAKGGGG